MSGDKGKRIFEALEILHNFTEDGFAEPALDEILDALIETSKNASVHDATGRSHAIFVAARSFQRQYRKTEIDCGA